MSHNTNTMTGNQKSFWSGTIITTMVVALVGVLTWGLLQSVKVPINEARNDGQFKNLNSNIVKLNTTGKETNIKLDTLTFQLGEFSKALLSTQIELKQVKKDCDYNTKVIRENKHNHKETYNYDYEK